MVEVDGKSVHLYCTGEGSPTAVIVADYTVPFHWEQLQEQLSVKTQVCSYDRLGTSYSDPTLAPRSVGNIVRELHGLVQAGGLGPQVILLGDGGGAVYARAFARAYPDRDCRGGDFKARTTGRSRST